MEEVEV
jgi:hypothetical protein